MQLNTDAVKNWIVPMGFAPQNGKSGIYCKTYASHSGYTIFIDFNSGKIIYDPEEEPKQNTVKVWEKTTCNFSQAENFVVLECVDRLLLKGYAPACIELEKTYPSGRGRSGRLDILVKTAAGVPFLMIECKTWGEEYEKEKARMSKNGGQLFSYYSSDRDAEYLCLYTSRVNSAAEYDNAVIDVEDGWRSLSGVKEIYDHWNKNFKDNGIFDSYAAPYHIRHRALTYGELKVLEEQDGGKVFHQIMEILRHNAISDKPNAFNKLLNLFVCKIVDENKDPEDELEFQWLESDTDESLQLRLNDLYKEGMWRFLEIDIIDYKQEDVIQRLANLDPDTRRWVMEMYTNTRLKKSPNFAFVEVQDERTFELNAKVVREIVELLQVYQFRYAQKHEFLGNFFELLLNTSMKQEAGQYFTPVPITRFILASLPLRELIQKRVDARLPEPLPTVIDYACGSGHFLTEYMSQMQAIIDSGAIKLQGASPDVRRQFQVWQGFIKFQWAKDTVYGIDLDNRLVKTTKVSAFFNGDGEANVVWANGLDHFAKSKTYRGKLKRAAGKENGQFDILISNPPYSVDAFKGTVMCGGESFELYPYLSDNSSEIECLFVERMKQLVKAGGWAAVILPSSILTNGGIYARTREILLKYFYIKAIVELGAGTFMKTGTNTVILFLERRSNNDYKTVMQEIEQFFVTNADVTVMGTEHAFSAYAACVYDELALDDYVSLFSGTPTETMKEHELYADYRKTFGENYTEDAIRIEKEKLLCFLLTYPQEIVLIKTGKGKAEKQFLGYEFSERRGHEGLHWLPAGTKLYDEADRLNPRKANGYIYRAFLGERIDIDPSMAGNVFYGRLFQFIEFGTGRFSQSINLGKRLKSSLQSKFPLVPLGNVVDIFNGGTPDTSVPEFWDGNICWATLADTKQKYLYSTERTITEAGLNSCNATLMPVNSVLFSSRATIGDVSIAKVPAATNQGYKNFVCKESFIHYEYLYYILKYEAKAIEALAGGMTYPEISKEKIGQFRIPLPPLEVQQKIVDELQRIEREEQTLQTEIADTQRAIAAVIEQCSQTVTGHVKLRKIASYSIEKVSAQSLDRDTYVGVDNLLPNVAGKRASDFVPTSGTATAYHPGNILLSNIRPYLKKAWLADNHGGSSGDVLVLVVDEEKAVPEYVFGFVSSDPFFDYEMQNIGSNVKMPRADKKKVLDFPIPLPSIPEQQSLADQIARKKADIFRLNTRLEALKDRWEAVLKKSL